MRKKGIVVVKRSTDFIGFKIKILGYSNPILIGTSGTIVFETRNTFRIRVGNRFLTVIKSNGFYELDFKRCHIIISGCKLVSKPSKRINRRWLK
jgi:ribonuclease P protein subunit POP4